MLKNHADPSYIPPTYLMDEVRPGEKYELVFTILKGGAFARYRCGDMYRCVGLETGKMRRGSHGLNMWIVCPGSLTSPDLLEFRKMESKMSSAFPNFQLQTGWQRRNIMSRTGHICTCTWNWSVMRY